MKLKELLDSDVFKDRKILTGTIGLSNPVASVMVLEAIDIENWSKKNQLILTSFYAFKDSTDAQIDLFFKKMQEIGICGLIVKVDRLIPMIPEWIIALSFKYEIPMIKVQQSVSYEAIMLAVFEPLLNRQTKLLRTYYEVRQRFMKVERNHASFEQIMHEFYQLIGHPCNLTISQLGINVSMGPLFKNYVVSDRQRMKSVDFTKNKYDKLSLFSHENNQYVKALQVEIVNPFNDACTLLVYQKDTHISEEKVMIIENVIDVIYERLQMEYLLKKERYNRMNNLADAILQDPPSDMTQLTLLLEEAHMNHYDCYQGIAYSSKHYDDNDRKKRVLQKLRGLKETHIFYEHHNYLIVLYNFQHPKYAITQETLSTIFDEQILDAEEGLLVISDTADKRLIKNILPQCLDTIRFNQQFYLSSILSYNDLGIFRMFIKDNQLDTLQQSIPEKLYHLWEEDSELFTTLYTFFIQNRSYKQTAETLFLHSKTIRYRLNKIEKMLCIDFSNPIQLINYEIGTYLLELKQRRSTE